MELGDVLKMSLHLNLWVSVKDKQFRNSELCRNSFPRVVVLFLWLLRP